MLRRHGFVEARQVVENFVAAEVEEVVPAEARLVRVGVFPLGLFLAGWKARPPSGGPSRGAVLCALGRTSFKACWTLAISSFTVARTRSQKMSETILSRARDGDASPTVQRCGGPARTALTHLLKLSVPARRLLKTPSRKNADVLK